MGKPWKSIKPMFKRDRWRIVRGDLVQIIAGKCKYEQGTVLRVIRDPRRPRVVVQSQNLHRRRFPARDGQPGFPVTIEAPLHYSNVMLVDPITLSKSSVHEGRVRDDGLPFTARVRSKYTWGQSHWLQGSQPWRGEVTGDETVGEKDTPPEAALEVTYDPSKDFKDFKHWPAAGSFASRQQRSLCTASSSLGHARGFAASAAEGVGCCGDHAEDKDEAQAWLSYRRSSDLGAVAAGLFPQRRCNPVLQLVRQMHSRSTTTTTTTTSSSSKDSSMNHLDGEQRSGVVTSTLASEVRIAALTATGWAMMAPMQWLQQRLSNTAARGSASAA